MILSYQGRAYILDNDCLKSSTIPVREQDGLQTFAVATATSTAERKPMDWISRLLLVLKYQSFSISYSYIDNTQIIALGYAFDLPWWFCGSNHHVGHGVHAMHTNTW